MQKSRRSNRHFSRDYGHKNRDRPGGHCPTPVLKGGLNSAWKEYLEADGRKYAKRFHAKGNRRVNKLLIAEELLMFWEQIAEEQIIYEEDYWDEYDYKYYYPDDYDAYEEYYDYYVFYEYDIYQLDNLCLSDERVRTNG